MVILAVGGIAINSLILSLRGEGALGVFNQVYAIYIILSQLGVGGLQFSALTHITYVQKDVQQSADIATAALVLVLIFSLAITLIGYALSSVAGTLLGSVDVQVGLKLVLPGLVFFALNKVLINILNALQQMRAYAVFRAIRFLLIPVFAVLIMVTGAPSAFLPATLTITEALLCMALVAYIYPHVLPLSRPRSLSRHLRVHLSFGLRGVMTGVLTEMNTRIDVLLLGFVASDSLVGLYSFAAILAEGFAQFPIAVRYNVDPQLGQYFARSERSAITSFSHQIRRIFVPIMVALGILAIMVYPIVFRVLSGNDGLVESWVVFGILTAGYTLTSGYSPFNDILLIGGLPGWQTGLMLFTVLVNIILGIVLIPLLNLYGAAVAVCSTILIGTIALIIISKRQLKVQL
jgi:O-antigen/teichoic acid export membrane protein